MIKPGGEILTAFFTVMIKGKHFLNTMMMLREV